MTHEQGKTDAGSAARIGRDPGGPRIALFTHDTYGLGHIRRCKHIAWAISRRAPEAAILFITGSPVAGAMRDLPPHTDYLKIPTLVQTGSPDRQPSHLPIGRRAVTSIRKRIVKSAVESFRPDVFLVDNFPLGSRKELRPVLERLRELGIPAVLGLRDIVDRPDVVRSTWAKQDIYEVLAQLYDRILVYGTREILDVAEAYALPSAVSEKLHYCGYVTSVTPPAQASRALPGQLGLARPIVLATVGGGGDGFPLLSRFVRAVRGAPGVAAVAVTGPLMAPEDRARIRELADGEPRILIEDAVEDLPSYMAMADLVVAMGGYNTVAELLAQRRWALVAPRNWRYGEHDRGVRAGREWEQLMRVQALERLGLLRVLTLEDLSPESLSREISTALAREGRVTGPQIDVSGVERAADRILSLIPSRNGHAQP